MSLPRKTFARKILTLKGYSFEQMIVEVASYDCVSLDEAQRRLNIAWEQHLNRCGAQFVRRRREKDFSKNLTL